MISNLKNQAPIPARTKSSTRVVEGLALYVRALSAKRHGTPKAFAARMKACGLSWVAIAAVWQDPTRAGAATRAANSPETFSRYAAALERQGIAVWAWGYPWTGLEADFAETVVRVGGKGRPVLLDPELGANPSRSSKGPRRAAADAHARELVGRVRDAGAPNVGLSTFGTHPRWFPLDAFLLAGVDFAGGQTYTDDARVDTSIASFLAAFERTGVRPQLVPNFGLYSWEGGRKVAGAKAISKSPLELRGHLYEYVDEGEPVTAAIGWAENFLTARQVPELARFAESMRRGACVLPRSA